MAVVSVLRLEALFMAAPVGKVGSKPVLLYGRQSAGI